MLYQNVIKSIFSLEYCKMDIENCNASKSGPYQVKIYTELHQKEY